MRPWGERSSDGLCWSVLGCWFSKVTKQRVEVRHEDDDASCCLGDGALHLVGCHWFAWLWRAVALELPALVLVAQLLLGEIQLCDGDAQGKPITVLSTLPCLIIDSRMNGVVVAEPVGELLVQDDGRQRVLDMFQAAVGTGIERRQVAALVGLEVPGGVGGPGVLLRWTRPEKGDVTSCCLVWAALACWLLLR